MDPDHHTTGTVSINDSNASRYMGGKRHADSWIRLYSAVIEAALKDLRSSDEEARRDAAEWIFSPSERHGSLRWMVGIIRQRFKDLHDYAPARPNVQSVRRRAREALGGERPD